MKTTDLLRLFITPLMTQSWQQAGLIQAIVNNDVEDMTPEAFMRFEVLSENLIHSAQLLARLSNALTQEAK